MAASSDHTPRARLAPSFTKRSQVYQCIAGNCPHCLAVALSAFPNAEESLRAKRTRRSASSATPGRRKGKGGRKVPKTRLQALTAHVAAAVSPVTALWGRSPAIREFDWTLDQFNTCRPSPPDGWSRYAVRGKQIQWKGITVGSGGVGKSCLCSRLRTDQFSAALPTISSTSVDPVRSRLVRTLGAASAQRAFTIDPVDSISVSLRDLESRERRIDAFSRLYTRNTSVALVVYDVMNVETIEPLREHVLSLFAPPELRCSQPWADPHGACWELHSPILVFVGTKLDLLAPNWEGGDCVTPGSKQLRALERHPKMRAARASLRKLFDQIGTWPHYFVSSKTGYGVPELRDCIFQVIQEASGMIERKYTLPHNYPKLIPLPRAQRLGLGVDGPKRTAALDHAVGLLFHSSGHVVPLEIVELICGLAGNFSEMERTVYHPKFAVDCWTSRLTTPGRLPSLEFREACLDRVWRIAESLYL